MSTTLRAFASSYQWRNVLFSAYRSGAGNHSFYRRSHAMITPTNIHGSVFSTKKEFSFVDYRRVHNGFNFNTKMEEDINKDKNVVPVARSSRKPILPTWVRWILGSMLSLLTMSKKRLEDLLTLEGQVENAAEAIENVAEVVEKVAEVAEIVSAKVADNLPNDSTLKDTALLVERVSKEAAKDAHLAQSLMHKVDELAQEVVETVVEPHPKPAKLLDKENGQRKSNL